MEHFLQANSVVSLLIGIGALVAGIGFAYAQFKSGSSKAKDDLIVTLKDTAVIEREKAARLAEEKVELVRSHQEQINLLNKNLGILQGRLDEQTAKLKEYKDIIEGRSPDQIEYTKKVLQTLELYLKDSKPKIDEIYKKTVK